MRIHATVFALSLIALSAALPALVLAQSAPDQTGYVSAADVQAQVETMRMSLKPGQTFLYRPLLHAGDASAAIEYWLAPRAPAIHPNQAEYVTVLAGAGTLVSGGTMIDPTTTNPTLIEGTRIEGGTTRTLHAGDVFPDSRRYAALVRHHRGAAGATGDEDRTNAEISAFFTCVTARGVPLCGGTRQAR